MTDDVGCSQRHQCPRCDISMDGKTYLIFFDRNMMSSFSVGLQQYDNGPYDVVYGRKAPVQYVVSDLVISSHIYDTL